ncbi:ornithine cyclodeaminase family protein [Streptomyces sp. NPDC048483]|uniref:ornithine cyclodeaminase family protein n=1 Tax=Streptomyces sp. NPDC048483 TaxID=3154927 RepID=UPI00341C62E7
MKQLKIISGAAVRQLVTLEDLFEPMRSALTEFSSGTAFQHPRVTVEPPGEGGRVLLMPAGEPESAAFGLKVLSMFPRSAEKGLPSVQGLIVLLDGVHGEVLAVLDGTVVTELRTAAVSAVGTDCLARQDAEVLAVIGAGVQAKAHIAALRSIRPWREVRVHSRRPERARELVAWAEAQGQPARLADSSDAAVRGADVLVTATSALEPVVSAAAVAAEGCHITAVGAFGPACRELPTEVVERCTVFAESRDALRREAGDLLIPVSEGRLPEDHPVVEIGDILAGRQGGRTDARETTLFKSLGLPIEDVVASHLVYRRALAAGAGDDVDFF